jgi:glycosyltransferase involved in cell wall biosynthesis
MRVLFVYSQHRGGNGSMNSTKATIDVCRQYGLEVDIFTRDSRDLPANLWGRLRAGASAIYAPGSVREFTARVDAFKPDVVHIYDVFPLISPWILPVCTRKGIPVVMTCDDYFLTCPVRTHLRDGHICTLCLGGREYWAVLKNCRHNIPESVVVAAHTALARKLRLFRGHVSRFIAASDFTSQWLIEHAGIEPARVATVPHVIEIPESPTDPASGNYVAFAGRFVPEKGIDTFLEAARICRLPFRLSRNERHFVHVDLPPDVDVVVTRGREDLSTFYRGARMVVFPSIWFETFGVVGAEAMSHSVPVVASRIGALGCLVDDGVDGLLFEPGNARDLADKVTRLWTDAELCRRFGRAAREKAISRWSAQPHFERLHEVYRQARPRL